MHATRGTIFQMTTQASVWKFIGERNEEKAYHHLIKVQSKVGDLPRRQEHPQILSALKVLFLLHQSTRKLTMEWPIVEEID
jgi:hypothetical protein